MCESFVTIANNDASSLECLVLCNSLKQTGTDKLISVIVHPSVSFHLKNVIRKCFDKVFYLNDLNVSCEDKSEFNVHGDFEKLKIWLLTDFTKCVFLESDVLVVENIDDLFDRLELSAASDPRWPDCFDAGVFVFQPSSKTYKLLIDYFIANPMSEDSFQCLLNMFFCDWNKISMSTKIPFIYNCQMNTTFYTHAAALVHFGPSIKAARMGHSTLDLMKSDSSRKNINNESWSKLWDIWWKIFNEMVKPAVKNNDSLNFERRGCDYVKKTDNTSADQQCSSEGVSSSTCLNMCSNQESICPSQDFIGSETQGELHESTFHTSSDIGIESVGVTEEAINEELDKTHRLRWERGEVDYMGQDSFENILVKLNSTLVTPNDEEISANVEE